MTASSAEQDLRTRHLSSMVMIGLEYCSAKLKARICRIQCHDFVECFQSLEIQVTNDLAILKDVFILKSQLEVLND